MHVLQYTNVYYVGESGAQANVRLGSRDYLLSDNWLNLEGGRCVNEYDGSASPTPSPSPSYIRPPTNDRFAKCVLCPFTLPRS